MKPRVTEKSCLFQDSPETCRIYTNPGADCPCPRYLDHQTVCNHNNNLISYFAEIAVDDIDEADGIVIANELRQYGENP